MVVMKIEAAYQHEVYEFVVLRFCIDFDVNVIVEQSKLGACPQVHPPSLATPLAHVTQKAYMFHRFLWNGKVVA